MKAVLTSGGFYPSYCQEEMEFENSDGTKTIFWYKVPIISFCDISLAEANKFKSYGEYGIGLSKNWATKSKLSPVVSVERNSLLADTYRTLFEYMEKQIAERENANLEGTELFISGINDNLLTIIKSMKNYEAAFIRKDELSPSGLMLDYRRFYDEREWRFFPKISKEEYTNYNYRDIFYERDFELFDKQSTKKPHFKHHLLLFSGKDIDYIIVPDSTHVSLMISFLKTQKHLFESEEELLILISKITAFVN